MKTRRSEFHQRTSKAAELHNTEAFPVEIRCKFLIHQYANESMNTPNHCPHCSARLPAGTPGDLCPLCVPEDEVGESGRVLGDCELFEEIGRGGMGVVWRGRQRGLDREVVVKTLPGGDLAGVEARARFHTEAKAAARLRHPGIVAVHEVGEADGMPYFIMEYIRGGTLANDQPRQPKTGARLLRDAALAVAHAHEHGVLHRDIKPTNILVEPSPEGGTAMVTDFGLAKLTDAESSLTMSGSAAGSPAYMSPEQASGMDSTTATDVYGLGATLYAVLTGRPPHAGASLATVLALVQREEPLAPRLLNPSIPRDLETICLRCLEKVPARRYRSARELAEDLTRFLHDEPVLARPVGTLERTVRYARRHPWNAAAISLALLMVAGVIAILAWRNMTERRHNADLAREQVATRLALLQTQLGEARAVIRLRQHDSRPRAEAILSKVLAANPPTESRDTARDLGFAAAALPTARMVPLPGEGVAIDDWTMCTGDLARNRWALGSYRGPIHVRSLENGEVLSGIEVAPRVVTALIGFSPGGRWLAVRHGEELGIWDTMDGAKHPSFAAHAWGAGRSFGFGKVAFTPSDDAALWQDGEALVATALPSGAELARWPAVAGALAFEPAGKWFAFALAGHASVELRSWPDGAAVQTYAGLFPRPLCALAVSPNAQLFAGGDLAGRVTLWRRIGAVESLIGLRGHGEAVRALEFSNDGKWLASTANDGTMRVWDCAVGAELLTVPFDAGCLRFSTDGHRIGAGVAGARLGYVEIEPSSILHGFRPPNLPRTPQVLSFAPNGKSLAFLTTDGVGSVAVPGGEALADFAAEGAISVRAVAGGVVTASREILHHTEKSAAVIVPGDTLAKWGWDALTASADGQWLAASDTAGARIALWPADSAHVPAEKKVRFITGDSDLGAGPIALSPDAALAAVAFRYEPGLRIIKTSDASELRRIDLPPRCAISWSPDGRQLAACGPQHFLWETATWQRRALPHLAANQPPAGAVAFSPLKNGASRLLALVEDNARIVLFDLTTSAIVARLESPEARSIYRLEFSPDHRWLGAATAGGAVLWWDLAKACPEL